MLKDLIFKNWKTTGFGILILFGLFYYNNPERLGGKNNVAYDVVKFLVEDKSVTGISIAILGVLSKDGDK